MTSAPLSSAPLGGAVTAARMILTRLHEVMASRSNAQTKLNTVVEVIGGSLDSEVCSIYLLREGMLELFATRGLAQEAVHVTRMALGEGLVGTIGARVETLNLAEATAHPDFSYRPETGEDKFHSFAGVPIVRRERAVGVLCVQHVDPRRYEEVEIEALQTVAMVLSELIANADLVDEEEAFGLTAAQTGPEQLRGLTLVKGLASGVAVYHQPRVNIEHVMAEDTEAERQRVFLAFDKMREQIDRMAGQAEFGVGGEHDEVLETYKMFAYDEGWARRINQAIDRRMHENPAISSIPIAEGTTISSNRSRPFNGGHANLNDKTLQPAARPKPNPRIDAIFNRVALAGRATAKVRSTNNKLAMTDDAIASR